MKKLLNISILILGMVFFSNTDAFAQEEFKIGAGLAFGSGVGFEGDFDNDLGLRVDGYYPVTPEIRVGGDFTFYFPKSEEVTEIIGGQILTAERTITVWELNLNGHYIFHEEDDLLIYGLGGINITGISQKTEGEFAGESDSESESDSEAGLNLGAGLEYAMGFGAIFGELKLGNLGGDADQFVLGAGVRFGL